MSNTDLIIILNCSPVVDSKLVHRSFLPNSLIFIVCRQTLPNIALLADYSLFTWGNESKTLDWNFREHLTTTFNHNLGREWEIQQTNGVLFLPVKFPKIFCNFSRYLIVCGKFQKFFAFFIKYVLCLLKKCQS